MKASARTSSSRKAHKLQNLEHVFDGLTVLNVDVASIDLGSGSHYVSVPDDRDAEPVRHFACFTADIEAMAAWLRQCRVRSVVMESTGVYWVSTYRILRDAGFEVLLVDAYHARNVPGRKSDVWDCRWLRRLHTYGLLNSCFVPPAQIEVVRTYWRHRASLVEKCSEQINLMQKSLEQMNVQLHKVITDISGLSGMKIIRAILNGQRNQTYLASLAHEKVKATQELLTKALTGDYRAEHLFTLKPAVDAFDFHHKQMHECDLQIEELMAQFEDKDPANPAPPDTSKRSRRKNQPHFNMGAELRRITGGHIKSRRTRRVVNRVAQALRLAAQSLHHSKSALRSFYRRVKGRSGPQKAVTAVAHKLARYVYRLLKYGEEYVAQGQRAHEQQYHERQVRAAIRQAQSLGPTLIDPTTGQVLQQTAAPTLQPAVS